MSVVATEIQATSGLGEPPLESGTYEVLRRRLSLLGEELRSRLARLNEARREVFGGVETALIATDRITTEHNCNPRDLTSIGEKLLLGYNVRFGLKSETTIADVFAVYEFRQGVFHAQPLDLIRDERFERDFRELYRYYKEATFARFAVRGPYLYMVFRAGRDVRDLKTFKWSIEGDRLAYVDNRSDHECTYPPQHEFSWVRVTRDDHRFGRHPHVSIDDRVFVETVGGDLTIKIEDNTESGEGIYSETVEHRDQTLDDAEIHYALLDNLVLLRVRPYLEQSDRYFVYNAKLQQAHRIDALAQACLLLPQDRGILFPGGYYLQTGRFKAFECGDEPMLFERRLAAANGEDFLYIFHAPESGTYLLMRYNLIEQTVDPPLVCQGSTLFPGGELVCFRAHVEPQRHHVLHVWRTPFAADEAAPPARRDSFLQTIGNREIVRGVADCYEIAVLLGNEEPYLQLYVDLVKRTSEVADAYFWLDRAEAFGLKKLLMDIHSAASAAVGEYEKVSRLRKHAAETIQASASKVGEIVESVRHRPLDHVDAFVSVLARLRALRGEILALHELRYAEKARIEALEAHVARETESLSQACADFLLEEQSLVPYRERITSLAGNISALSTAREAAELEKELLKVSGELEMLVEIAGNLGIDDAARRTRIVDRIADEFVELNRTRAAVRQRRQELGSTEAVAEFNSQVKLLQQAVVNFLDLCDRPEKCEQFLAKALLQLEEMEARFADFDSFLLELADKRNEVQAAFETRRLNLVEKRNQHCTALLAAADRVLSGIQTRVANLATLEEISGYFASDPMVEKVRDIIRQLRELGDTVKVDDLQGRLKTVQEDAVRQLKDRHDLYEDGGAIIRLGPHRFSVHPHPLELTVILRGDQLCLHLTGTQFFQPLSDDVLLAERDVWNQDLVSESRDIYRGEFLAFSAWKSLGKGDMPREEVARGLDLPSLVTLMQAFMGPRFHEGYVKGIHDHDSAVILQALLEMHGTLGPLRYGSHARALARVYWHGFGDKKLKQRVLARIEAQRPLLQAYPDVAARSTHLAELASMLREFADATAVFSGTSAEEAAGYLLEELLARNAFAWGRDLYTLHEEFHADLRRRGAAAEFAHSLASLERDPLGRLSLLRDWCQAFLESWAGGEDREFADELAAVHFCGESRPERIIEASNRRTLTGLRGEHALIVGGTYRLHYHRFLAKLDQYQHEGAPRFERFVARKRELVARARSEMKLDDLRPKVLTSFVRNTLIDTVYLPLIGANLAKQLGAAGDAKRTDRMGLLLLVSPPGYGKTTLMEYVAHRLGLVFIKINGPALGDRVRSLDPAEAPNAAAREELEQLNLAFDVGDNVMIYVDDIQHCHPEFLQQFISLCDAQRQIEGVRLGKSRTYDLRGRKVAVVMAGNPYTESGRTFRVPDMLANRADVYNLGEIIGNARDAFELSYLENAMGSNPILRPLAHRARGDLAGILQLAMGAPRDEVVLEGDFAAEELDDYVNVLRKLLRVRDAVLKVNREYIRSAAQADEYRTEPPFKLQGSYRNMNRIAERVVPVMTDEELERLILSSYESDAQTLAGDTESNLLKLKELWGMLAERESRRWEEIKAAFRRHLRLRGLGENQEAAQVIAELQALGQGVDAIGQALGAGIQQLANANPAEISAGTLRHAQLVTHLDVIAAELRRLHETLAERGRSDESGDLGSASPGPMAIQASLADVTASLNRLAGSLDKPPPTDTEGKITIVNKLPSSLANVIRHQFALIHNWLVPLTNSSNLQAEQLRALRQGVQDCAQAYRDLVTNMQARPEKSDS